MHTDELYIIKVPEVVKEFLLEGQITAIRISGRPFREDEVRAKQSKQQLLRDGYAQKIELEIDNADVVEFRMDQTSFGTGITIHRRPAEGWERKTE